MVSVIIPIRRGEDISKTLEALRASLVRDATIQEIVVDEGLERSAQRNIGISRAKGKYILILDSDQRVHYELINECISIIK